MIGLEVGVNDRRSGSGMSRLSRSNAEWVGCHFLHQEGLGKNKQDRIEQTFLNALKWSTHAEEEVEDTDKMTVRVQNALSKPVSHGARDQQPRAEAGRAPGR